MGLTHPPRQLGGGIRPHAVGPEPVIPTAYRLMRTEVGRERSPGAACMLQVETAVHHLAHIGGESKVAGEQRFDDIPFRVRQVARIASPISLVFLTVLVCPHPNLLLAAFNSRQGKSVKQALSLAPERGVDLETWCEANCQAHFSRQGYDFFFEDQKDYKLFET